MKKLSSLLLLILVLCFTNLPTFADGETGQGRYRNCQEGYILTKDGCSVGDGSSNSASSASNSTFDDILNLLGLK